MPHRELVQWVTVPAGFTADGARARVLIFAAPQLTIDPELAGEAVLGRFPSWLSWPERMARTTCYLEFADGTAVAADRVGAAPDARLWRALFPAETALRSFQPRDPTMVALISYSVPEVAGMLEAAYARAGTLAVDEVPVVHAAENGLAEIFGDIAVAYRDPRWNALFSADDDTVATFFADRVNFAQQNRVAGALNEVFPAANTGADHFARAYAFHRTGATRRGGALVPPEPFDFHQLLTTLADHPALLRALGIVTELEFPAEALAAAGRIRVRPLWTPASGMSDEPIQYAGQQPWTEFTVEETSFAATERIGPTGLIDLGSGRFRVGQLDVDSAVHKALGLVTGFGDAERAAPPSLRTSGLSLIRSDRAGHLNELFSGIHDKQLNDGENVLFAEDLVRGYRLDVYDSTARRWYSLHERRVRYTVENGPEIEPVADEGFVQDAHTTAETSDQVVYLHETMITWDGWSLAAARPGMSLSTDPRAAPIRPENSAHNSMGLRADTVAAPGTLPRLRFGRGYQLRLRTVDLAGHGLTREEADAAPEVGTGLTIFRRFEPVPAPVVVPLAAYSEGAQQYRLVVRGPAIDDPLRLDPALTRPDIREIVPPKASLQLVEQHGLLDSAIGSDSAAERERIYRIAARESGTLEHGLVDGALPYLPDPMCVGVVFFDLPGIFEKTPFPVDFTFAEWYAPQPIRLRLVPFVSGPDTAPEWDAQRSELTVYLRAGRECAIRMASKIADPELLAFLDWSRNALGEQEYRALAESVAASRNCMVTPWQEITLVHAVPRPWNLLNFTDFAIRRDPGRVEARAAGWIDSVDAESTQRVELVAGWTETVDEGGPAPVTRTGRQVAGRSEISRDPRQTWGWTAPRAVAFGDWSAHSFGDAKHRTVQYQLRATGRFAEYFPRALSEDDAAVVTGPPVEWNLLNTAPVPPPIVEDVVPVLDRTATAAGSVRDGGWIRVYLARPWYATGEGELLGVVTAPSQPESAEAEFPGSMLHGLVSLCGQDETRFSPDTPGLTPDRLLDAVTVVHDVRLVEVFGSFFGALTMPQVSVAGYAPAFDAHGRCYCDIHLDLGALYFPFVRLAVVRFQPDAFRWLGSSADDMMVSPVVLVDIVQTVPGRTLSITRRPDGLFDISLSGTTYFGVADQWGRLATEPAARARVTARLQTRDPSIADDLLAWTDSGEPVVLTRVADAMQDDYWHAVMRVPPAQAPDQRRRLLIVEEDRIATDFGTPADATGYASRVVYAETYEV